jgi:hypothetical protein
MSDGLRQSWQPLLPTKNDSGGAAARPELLDDPLNSLGAFSDGVRELLPAP